MTTTEKRYPLLHKIDSPADLRQLAETELEPLAHELRNFLIQSVSKTGGHLSSSLGTVELTVALHYVYNTPDDRLVWDVGHQAYPHKILTGRRERMDTLRKKDGLSGFIKRDESEYDTFGVGHSSTSISAALGMAIAAQKSGSHRKAVAIIGDGAMTAGMAFEALNHAGHLDNDLLVILNDNEMSISPNVGGMSNYLAKLLSGKLYTSVRESGKKVLSVVPPMRELARRAEEHMKGMVIPGTLFEELGFHYYGPVDGHDIPTLITTLQNLQQHKGPQFLHVVTKKGRGYQPAEDNPCTYHGVTPFDPGSGRMHPSQASGPSYTEVFGEWLCDMAKEEPNLIAITPAMCEGSGMVKFSRLFADRFYDVGIAEQHAVTLAAGLACDGIKPVVAIYSTFLQRAYDQLIHDVAIQNLPVIFAIDRAGLVGADGATHAGSFDLSYLRCIPNMVVMAPSDENECRQMLYTAARHNGPTAVRYPRGRGPGTAVEKRMKPLELGKGRILRQGSAVAILAFGSRVQAALAAADELNATVVDMRFVKPIDEALIVTMASSHELLLTIEENVVMGGAGSAVNEVLAAHNIAIPLINLGLPDEYWEQGEHESLLEAYGLGQEGIINAVNHFHQQASCNTIAARTNPH
ncbi:MAG TPA: 1-deoxy-D-xylulose-5-phosphate synthase [Chromatiales bacterium]|nr:1-deoxy-D-xylulose-5-phosphate synthase [Chromatiales bacterium]